MLRGRGAATAEITRAGMPVPLRLHHHDRALLDYLRKQGRAARRLWKQATSALAKNEKQAGKRYGDPRSRLMVMSGSELAAVAI